MQGQEGRVDRAPQGEEGCCPGPLTSSSSSSSASSSSLFAPSSPPRMRRGIKAQLLRGMQGGGAGRGGKQSAARSHSDDTFTFLLVQIHSARGVRALPARADPRLDCDHSAPASLVPNTRNHIPLSFSRPGVLLHSSPFTFSTSSPSRAPPTNQ